MANAVTVVITKCYDVITVNTSPEAFRKFGFPNLRSGDKVLDPGGNPSTLIGFARIGFINEYLKKAYPNYLKFVLWYIREKDGVKASYWDMEKEVREKDFTPIKEEKK